MINLYNQDSIIENAIFTKTISLVNSCYYVCMD